MKIFRLNIYNRILIILLLILFNINALFLPFNLDILNQAPSTNDVILSLTHNVSFLPVSDTKKPAFKHLSSNPFFTCIPFAFFIYVPQLHSEKRNPFNFRQKIERMLSDYFHGTKYKHITSKI